MGDALGGGGDCAVGAEGEGGGEDTDVVGDVGIEEGAENGRAAFDEQGGDAALEEERQDVGRPGIGGHDDLLDAGRKVGPQL